MVNADVSYLLSAQGIFRQFCFPRDHLPNDFSSCLVLEEGCSLSCVLSLSNSETEVGDGREKEDHAVNIVFATALILHYLPLSKAWSSISVALSAHHFVERKIPQ